MSVSKYIPTGRTLNLGYEDPFTAVISNPERFSGVSFLLQSGSQQEYPLLLLALNYPEVFEALLSLYSLPPWLLSQLTEVEKLDLLWLLQSGGPPFRPPLSFAAMSNWFRTGLTPKRLERVKSYNLGVLTFAYITGSYVSHSSGHTQRTSALVTLNTGLIYGLQYTDFAPSTFASWYDTQLDPLAGNITVATYSQVATTYGMILPLGPSFPTLYTLLQRLTEYRAVIFRPTVPLPPLLSGPIYPEIHLSPEEKEEITLELSRAEIISLLYTDEEIKEFYAGTREDLSTLLGKGSIWWYNPDYPGLLNYGTPNTHQTYTARELESSFRIYSNALGYRVRRFPIPQGRALSAYSVVPSFGIYSLSLLLRVIGPHISQDADLLALYNTLSLQLRLRRLENSPAIFTNFYQDLSFSRTSTLTDLCLAFLQGMFNRGWKGIGFDWAYTSSTPLQVKLGGGYLNMPLLAFDWLTGYVSTVQGPNKYLGTLVNEGQVASGEVILSCAYAYLFLALQDIGDINIEISRTLNQLKGPLDVKSPIYYDFLPTLMRG